MLRLDTSTMSKVECPVGLSFCRFVADESRLSLKILILLWMITGVPPAEIPILLKSLVSRGSWSRDCLTSGVSGTVLLMKTKLRSCSMFLPRM